MPSFRKIFFSTLRSKGERKIYAEPSVTIRQVLTMNDINKTGYVYLLASKLVGTTYLGVTSDLIKRVAEHKAGVYKGFTYKHGIHRLVYYQECGSIEAAIAQEKKLKKWRRAWKIQLIEKMNPDWRDLYPKLVGYNK